MKLAPGVPMPTAASLTVYEHPSGLSVADPHLAGTCLVQTTTSTSLAVFNVRHYSKLTKLNSWIFDLVYHPKNENTILFVNHHLDVLNCENVIIHKLNLKDISAY